MGIAAGVGIVDAREGVGETTGPVPAGEVAREGRSGEMTGEIERGEGPGAGDAPRDVCGDAWSESARLGGS